jgi:PAS domain-containing protein
LNISFLTSINGFKSTFRREEGVYVYFQDITGRKKVEERLHQSEKRFRALIVNNADGIALFDRQVNMVYVSASITRILGYDPEELRGGNALELVHPDELEPTLQRFSTVLQQLGMSIAAKKKWPFLESGEPPCSSQRMTGCVHSLSNRIVTKGRQLLREEAARRTRSRVQLACFRPILPRYVIRRCACKSPAPGRDH